MVEETLAVFNSDLVKPEDEDLVGSKLAFVPPKIAVFDDEGDLAAS